MSSTARSGPKSLVRFWISIIERDLLAARTERARARLGSPRPGGGPRYERGGQSPYPAPPRRSSRNTETRGQGRAVRRQGPSSWRHPARARGYKGGFATAPAGGRTPWTPSSCRARSRSSLRASLGAALPLFRRWSERGLHLFVARLGRDLPRDDLPPPPAAPGRGRATAGGDAHLHAAGTPSLGPWVAALARDPAPASCSSGSGCRRAGGRSAPNPHTRPVVGDVPRAERCTR